jgi:hypothetical protein
MKVKRYLVVIIPFLLLTIIVFRLDSTDIMFVFIGLMWIAQGIWRPQLDRFLRPEKPLDDGLDYQWIRAFMICAGLGFLSSGILELLTPPGNDFPPIFVYLFALGFVLYPVFFVVGQRRSSEQALLHEALTAIGIGLLGVGGLATWIVFSNNYTLPLCFVFFVPALLAFLAALITWANWRERQAHPDMPERRAEQ